MSLDRPRCLQNMAGYYAVRGYKANRLINGIVMGRQTLLS